MRRRIILRVGLATGVALAALGIARRDDLFEKRVRVVESGALFRGAWQRPGPLRRMIEREGIRTVVTLTAINRDDPKYVAQEPVVRETGADWIVVPMRGSTATLEQLAETADLLADPARRPVFFHCVGGHHRTGLVHAAYRIRHQGWTAERAWAELLDLPWTRPEQDVDDRLVIEAFAAAERARRQTIASEVHDDSIDDSQGDPAAAGRAAGGGPGRRPAGGLSPGHG